jgi:hypothetical protein
MELQYTLAKVSATDEMWDTQEDGLGIGANFGGQNWIKWIISCGQAEETRRESWEGLSSPSHDYWRSRDEISGSCDKRLCQRTNSYLL